MKIGITLMHGFMRGLSALPLGFHYAWAGFFAWLLKDVLRYRRNVVMINLARSFPDKKYWELNDISARFYRHFGRIIAEAVWFGGCRKEERLHRQHLVEVTNPEVFDQAFLSSPGVMMLVSHSGNWELLGGLACYDYRPSHERVFPVNDVAVVYKPLTSPFWNEIMRLNRCAPVLHYDYPGYISHLEFLRHALAHRHEKKAYMVPADQYPYKDAMAHDSVDFMHQSTPTMLGGASVAHKLGMSVLYVNMRPVARGRYEWTYTEICPDASRMTPHEIISDYYTLLQRDLEQTPWNYLWTHKRWK